MPRGGPDEDGAEGWARDNGGAGGDPPTTARANRFGSFTAMPSLAPPGRNPSGVYFSGAPSLVPGGPPPAGGGFGQVLPSLEPPTDKKERYGERVRNWGDNIYRPAEESAAQHLAPPTRMASNAGSFQMRLNSPVLVPSNRPMQTAPPPTRAKSRRASTTLETVRERPTLKGGVSTLQGLKTLRVSVLPVSGIQQSVRASTAGSILATPKQNLSFTPQRLLDVENGKSLLVTKEKFLDTTRYQPIGEDGAVVVVTARATAPIAKEDTIFFQERGRSLQDQIQDGNIRDLQYGNEVGLMGGAWRGTLRRLMLSALDDVNAARLGRLLQLFLPFLTGYEAYLVSQIIEVFDHKPIRKEEVDFVLKIAFTNRNVSRILVQTIGPRWDFFWHAYQAVTNNRKFDAFGQLPFIGITSFPATENFPATRNHVIASVARVALGQGGWITRVLTGNRQGLNTDHPERNVAQNLAAESNGFETANRNQFGTYIGRRKTNEFRLDHRLPTDESIVRTFVANPMPTMVNNGVVHTLRQLAKHWHNMLYQDSGNFAHQRMEQLDPFETMRFHVPAVCVILSNLRGRNRWDSDVLGPFMRKCQELKPSFGADGCRYLAREMQEHIVADLTAGVASVYDPLYSWLDAIVESCNMIEEEAKEVYQKVTSVEIGLRLGHDLMTQVSWQIPNDTELKEAILFHIKGKPSSQKVSERRVRSALLLTTPRDKRTLIELVKLGHEKTEPAQLLLGRVKTLLQRDIRREALNEGIQELALGDFTTDLTPEEWYWLQEGEKRAVYIYSGKQTGKDEHRFIHVDSGHDKFVSLGDGAVKCREYIPVAESIARAQRCYMNIEVDHGKKFKYNAFMEFSFLRIALRRLAVVSQIFCEEIDTARLNVLREVQRSNQTQVGIGEMEVGRTYYTYDQKTKSYEPFVCKKQYTPADPEWNLLARTKILKVPPQNMIVIGGGPTGLMTVVHCTENVLTSGGVMKLFEARDAFYAGGATFERAQIVRLDARWIAMLRYHLGTGFEDIYIPASGETDAQLGNTLPTQGFVEITIKDLENMLHVEVSRMWSKGLIQCYTNSRAKYDPGSNTLTKQGEHLKLEDAILRRVDPNGNPSKEYFSWKVASLIYQKPLSLDELEVGRDYGVFVREENAVLPFKLVTVDLRTSTYNFSALMKGKSDLTASAHNLPSIYPKGTRKHAEITKVIVESVQKGKRGGYEREELPMPVIRNQNFTMDIGHTHVVECIGKPHGSKVHLSITTYEPYGVCCISGLKISMGMHNFGEKRFGTGLLDDFRSTNDQNTRIIGDFTKMVRQPMIAEHMLELMSSENWQTHFLTVIKDSPFPSLDDLDPVIPKLKKAIAWHAANARSFKRQTLQTRFFETGDNYYLGMEFTREYDKWKNDTVDELVASLALRDMDASGKKDLGRLRGALAHHIDRLWYESCLEIIREGDVYNPGARKRVPKIYTINSYTPIELHSIPVGESFRLKANEEEKKNEKYEVIVKNGSQILVRNVEGYISQMEGKTMILREGNLARGPDGNKESKVALATFPVGHYVNFRTVRLNNEARGYVFAFIGDEQSTPHFMRYSGLTGACINAMLVNNFVGQSLDGISFADRFKIYSKETNWSNGEVVTRGTGSNYGRDGFLRPGFPYRDGIDYLHSKVIEWMETGQDLDDILSRDWKSKFAAALVPKGMELNTTFIRALYKQTRSIVFDKFIEVVKNDDQINEAGFVDQLCASKASRDDNEISYATFWDQLVYSIDGVEETKLDYLRDYHIEIAKRVDQTIAQVVEFATKGYLYDERITAELYHQPKPVDSIVDDFAVEAQNFANSLVMSAAFSAGAIAFTLFDMRLGGERNIGKIFGSILGAVNIFLTFGTMANVSRYKIRNEEARVFFFDEKLPGVLKAVFAIVPRDKQDASLRQCSPFEAALEKQIEKLRYDVNYYNVQSTKASGLDAAYQTLQKNTNDPEAIKAFQEELAGKFIAESYHHSSYIQESLVDLYTTCSEMVDLLEQEQDEDRRTNGAATEHLFIRLKNFVPRLNNSLQRGHIYWGFLKHRRFGHWDICVVLRYFYSLIWYASPRSTNPIAPIQTETLGVLREARNVSSNFQHTVLRREIRDLDHLFWATRESDVASMIFVAAFIVHMLSWIFTISRVVTVAGGSDVITSAAAWASIGSTFGALLAAFHFTRKLVILFFLWLTLGGKARDAKTTDDSIAIRKVKRVTMTQIFLTFLRFMAAYGAAVALPWSVAVNEFPDHADAYPEAPFWIALGSVCSALLATVLFFVIEYRVRYDLTPRLGEFVCEAYRDEIELMYKVLEKPTNDIETKQQQEKETWEYVAREFLHKYRFDTVFAADRFGSILQYIQSGMSPRK